MNQGSKGFSVLGKSVPLVDAFEKVTGQLRYAGDLTAPGMLHARVLRSPYAHARILSIDTSKAESLPGVRATITHKNIPDKEWLCGHINFFQKVMDSVVRYVGDDVAAVAADDEAIAEQAIRLIEVEYEQLPAVFDIEEAMKPGAPEVRGGGNAYRRSLTTWGDVEKGFKESDIIVERRSTMGFQQHCPMDRNACITSWTGDKVTVWTGTQDAFDLRDRLADYFEIPKHHVRVIQSPVGSSNGLWWTMNYHLVTALLARKAARPVRLELSREEVTSTTKRREHPVSHVRLGVSKDGRVIAGDYKHIFDNGAYGFKPDPFQGASDLYRCEHGRYEAVGVNTNLMTAGCMRGVGDLTLQYAVEQVVDMAAEKLDMDPVDFRMKNHYQPGDVLNCSAEKIRTAFLFGDKPLPVLRVSSVGLDECLEKGSALIDWKRKWRGWGKPVAVEGARRRGIGVGIAQHFSGISTLGATGAVVKLNTDGTATLVLGPGRQGQGADTTQCQLVAEVLGIRAEDVIFAEVDTMYTPEVAATVGSTTAFIVSRVTKAASDDAREKVLDIASRYLEADADELDIRDRRIFVKSRPEKGMSVAECLSRPLYETLAPPAVVGSASFGHPATEVARMTMAGYAEVEIDTETGILKVIDYAQVH
ncbi:MAG: molybdopterin-dependent oxidoreductase, partial [Dehalococcoidia bacterium]|nr:molybdopterin-dependent oxidoreductase [Dehalococcoidia bacterium]